MILLPELVVMRGIAILQGSSPLYNPSRTRGMDAAVRAYKSRNITVARGAEIAGVPTDRFKEELEKRGVEVRYGPDSVEELYQGSEL